ncbi:MAG TPA: hypothetical protein VGF75_05240 [Candidatus Saccharimonadales bacterium]|jgi:hypothetical protein
MTAPSYEQGRAASETATCLGLIDGSAIDAILDDLGNLNDKDALETMLISNQALTSFDPAGYLIARHAGFTSAEGEVPIRPYDFGVAFAGALVRKTIDGKGLKEVVLIPAVPEAGIDPVKPKLVDEYLDKSRKTPVADLISSDAISLPEGLVGAINLFADKVRLVVMRGFNLDDYKEEVQRGSYDYFRVISMLENPEAETARRGLEHMMRGRLKRSSRPRQTAA